MKKRMLGGLEVSAVGYGCMGLSHAYGTALEKADAIDRIRTAYDLGCTFFDTAELYVGKFADGTPAPNEEVVGEALRPIRDKVIICTKGGLHWDNGATVPDASLESIRTSVEASLKRLGIETIDLYYQHRQDKTREPEDVAEVFSELIREGKIRHWGISNATYDYIARADKVCKVTAVQLRYSMMARWTEELFPLLEERNIGAVAYSPIANGFLSGKVQTADKYDRDTDFRSFMPQYQAEEMEKSKALLTMIEQLAKEKDATPAQISLAWMLCKKEYIVPIPGSTKPERIKENLGAADVFLTKDEIKEIDDALDGMNLKVFGGV